LLKGRCEIVVGSLACGDYLINSRILAERKTARDLLLSLIDLRLFRQIRRLKDTAFKTVLIVEGDPFRTDLDFTPEAVKGALLSCQVVWQLPVLFTRSTGETAEILLAMGRQDLKYRDVVLLRGGYRPRRLRTRQLYLLQGLPRVGPVMAKRLLEHFGSLAEMLNSPARELAAVRGIGPKRTLLIRGVLNDHFEKHVETAAKQL
jgi:ERCC4-type nuclease